MSSQPSQVQTTKTNNRPTDEPKNTTIVYKPCENLSNYSTVASPFLLLKFTGCEASVGFANPANNPRISYPNRSQNAVGYTWLLLVVGCQHATLAPVAIANFKAKTTHNRQATNVGTRSCPCHRCRPRPCHH